MLHHCVPVSSLRHGCKSRFNEAVQEKRQPDMSEEEVDRWSRGILLFICITGVIFAVIVGVNDPDASLLHIITGVVVIITVGGIGLALDRASRRRGAKKLRHAAEDPADSHRRDEGGHSRRTPYAVDVLRSWLARVDSDRAGHRGACPLSSR